MWIRIRGECVRWRGSIRCFHLGRVIRQIRRTGARLLLLGSIVNYRTNKGVGIDSSVDTSLGTGCYLLHDKQTPLERPIWPAYLECS